MAFTKWEVVLGKHGRTGRTKVVMDGEDITHLIRSIEIRAAVDEITTVKVEYLAEGDIQVEEESDGDLG